jgi:hypothetical protein
MRIADPHGVAPVCSGSSSFRGLTLTAYAKLSLNKPNFHLKRSVLNVDIVNAGSPSCLCEGACDLGRVFLSPSPAGARKSCWFRRQSRKTYVLRRIVNPMGLMDGHVIFFAARRVGCLGCFTNSDSAASIAGMSISLGSRRPSHPTSSACRG